MTDNIIDFNYFRNKLSNDSKLTLEEKEAFTVSQEIGALVYLVDDIIMPRIIYNVIGDVEEGDSFAVPSYLSIAITACLYPAIEELIDQEAIDVELNSDGTYNVELNMEIVEPIIKVVVENYSMLLKE